MTINEAMHNDSKDFGKTSEGDQPPMQMLGFNYTNLNYLQNKNAAIVKAERRSSEAISPIQISPFPSPRSPDLSSAQCSRSPSHSPRNDWNTGHKGGDRKNLLSVGHLNRNESKT